MALELQGNCISEQNKCLKKKSHPERNTLQSQKLNLLLLPPCWQYNQSFLRYNESRPRYKTGLQLTPASNPQAAVTCKAPSHDTEPSLFLHTAPPFIGSHPDSLHRSHAKPRGKVVCPVYSHAKLCREVIRDVLAPLLLQHHPQAAAEGSGQRRRDGIADLPVAVVHVAGELEVVREALRIEVRS